MNLNKYHILILLKKHQKVTEVAKKLEISQPTVTFHMKSLEQEFDVPLFHSRSGRILLTEAGNAISHYAEKIVALVEECQKINQAYLALQTGSLSIGASYVPAAYILPNSISDFKTQYPKAKISLAVKPAPVILQSLHAYQLDVGFISSLPPVSPEIKFKPIHEDELVMVSHPGSFLADPDWFNPDTLKTVDFISHGEDSTTYKMVEKWMKHHTISWKSHIQVDNLEIIKRILISGWGFSILSSLAVAEEVRQGTLLARQLPGALLNRTIYMAYLEEHWQSPLMKAFIHQFTNGSA